MTAMYSILCLCFLVLLQTDVVFMNSNPPPVNNDQTSSPPPTPSSNTHAPPETNQPSDGYEAPTSPAPPVSPPPPQKETNVPQGKDTVQTPPVSKPNPSPPNNPNDVPPNPPPVADASTKADTGECAADNSEVSSSLLTISNFCFILEWLFKLPQGSSQEYQYLGV